MKEAKQSTPENADKANAPASTNIITQDMDADDQNPLSNYFNLKR